MFGRRFSPLSSMVSKGLRIIARKSNKKRRHVSSITSLPQELLMEVLAKVASSSLTDLHTARLCCKDFLGATEDDYIYQNISIEEVPFIPWTPCKELSLFLDRCMGSGNAEALYRRGMVEYFSSLMNVHTGFELLKMAATKGHREATYVYSVILICSSSGNQSKEQGIKLLLSLIRSRSITRCRNKVKRFIRSMWIRNKMIHQNNDLPVSICQSETCNKNVAERLQLRLKPRGWPSAKDDEDNDHGDDSEYCEFCRLEEEVTIFCTMVYNHP